MEYNLNLPPFYVGQKIICIKSHSKLLYKKNEKFTVKNVIKGCQHYNYLLLLGVQIDAVETRCDFCKTLLYSGTELACAPDKFRPLIQISFPLIKLTKVIDKEKELICTN